MLLLRFCTQDKGSAKRSRNRLQSQSMRDNTHNSYHNDEHQELWNHVHSIFLLLSGRNCLAWQEAGICYLHDSSFPLAEDIENLIFTISNMSGIVRNLKPLSNG